MLAPNSLGDYLKILYDHDDLQRVDVEVNPELEIASIVDRICKGQGRNKALLFDNVKESVLPLVVNIFGSEKRMELVLGAESIEKLATTFKADLETAGKERSTEALRELLNFQSRRFDLLGQADWQQSEVTDNGLIALPALKSWPYDGGRYLTLAQVFSRSPDGTDLNCGIYRVQVIDAHTALLRCHPGAGGARHLKAWHQSGQTMPIAIVLGGPPALTWAAGISLPKGVSEIDFVRYLAKIDLPMSLCCQSSLTVPATSEIVIEGTIEPGDEMLEGPFGNHSGYYASPALAPVIRINSIRMKPDSIYSCTVVGPPPMENRFMAKTAERVLLQLLQYDYPWVADVHMPTEGIYHRAAIVAIAGQMRLDLEEIREALLSSQLLKNSKCLVLVDEGCIELEAMQQVYWKVVNNMKCRQHAGGVVVDARSAEGAIQVHHDQLVEAAVSERWQKYKFF